MIDYGKQQSTVEPERMIVDDYSVWINTNIEEIEDSWTFNIKQYSKDEYIALLDKQLTDTQLALCEIYEGLV